MSSNFRQVIKLVFGSEGGYVNHPKDPGGATKYGITAATLGASRGLGRKATPAEVKALTLDEADRILTKNYAIPIRYEGLPVGVDYALFDFAVNSGPSRAVKEIQRVLRVGVDGIMGDKTLQAINDYADKSKLVNLYLDARYAFLRKLKTWPTFGKGWTNRVADVRRGALAMIGKAATTPAVAPATITEEVAVSLPATCTSQPENAANVQARSEDIKLSSTTEGKGAIGGMIGTATAAVGSAKDALEPLVGNSGFVDHVFTYLTVGGVVLTLAGLAVVWAGKIKNVAQEGATA